MTPVWMVLVAALWFAVALLLVMVLGLSRRVRDLSEAWAEDPVRPEHADGAALGPRLGSTVDLVPMSSPATVGGPGRDRVVLFLNSSCGASHMLGDELIAAGEDGFVMVGSDLVLVTDELGAEFYRALGADEIVVQPANEISRQLGIIATPYGIAVDVSGIVRWSGIVGNFDDVLAMVAAFGMDTH
ncbi:MAG TPA: hypothetical protein VGL69_03285 [Solirubrobacteraceae bacterium]|jgi:hypothetical protein